jgi:hypothetical protein
VLAGVRNSRLVRSSAMPTAIASLRKTQGPGPFPIKSVVKNKPHCHKTAGRVVGIPRSPRGETSCVSSFTVVDRFLSYSYQPLADLRSILRGRLNKISRTGTRGRDDGALFHCRLVREESRQCPRHLYSSIQRWVLMPRSSQRNGMHNEIFGRSRSRRLQQ